MENKSNTTMATYPQKKYCWAFEIRHSQNKPADWRKIDISLERAAALISDCKSFEAGKFQGDGISSRVRFYSPNFQLKEKVVEVKVETKTEIHEILDTKLDTILKGLKDSHFIKGVNTLELKIKEQLEKAVAAAKPKAKKPKSKDYIKPALWDEVYMTVKANINTLIFGDAGAGKSRLGKELAKSLKLEFFTVSVGGGMRYAQVFGGDKLKIKNGKQYSEFEPSDLLKAIQKPCLVLIDEIFAADPEVLLGLNSLLEGDSRSIQTKSGLIEAHKDCRFVACANTNGRAIDRNYTGAIRADASLLDRFAKVKMTYDLQVEKELMKDTTEKVLLTKNIEALRDVCKRDNIQFSPSTRRLKSCIDIMRAGLVLKKAFDMAFLNDLTVTEKAKFTFTEV